MNLTRIRKNAPKMLILRKIACIIFMISISVSSIGLMSGCGKDNNKQEPEKTTKNNSSKETDKKGTKKSTDKKKVEEKKEPVKVKGIYLTAWNAGIDKKLDHFIDLINKTELNSVVLDVKSDDGFIGYSSSIPLIKEIRACEKRYDPVKVLKKLHDNDIYTIGRIVCFKDPILSSRKPQYAIKNSSGDLWYAKGITWLDPYNKDCWPIIVETAKEAIKLGFDEIQFDYLRFPNEGVVSEMTFNTGEKQRYEIINEFIAYARAQMPKDIISGDVFGIICESPEDTEKIGQYLEKIGEKDLDYISPMVYPSHYKGGQIINKVPFDKPDLQPYEVVLNTLLRSKDRISKVSGYRAKMRPFLQDFTANWLGSGYYKKYTADDVKAQIKAVYDAGYEEWLMWNPGNIYNEDAFLPEDPKNTKS